MVVEDSESSGRVLMLEVAYQPTDYARANGYLLSRKPIMWFVYLIPALIFLGLGTRLYLLSSGDSEGPTILAVLAMITFLYVFGYLFARWNRLRLIKQQLKSNPSAQSAQVYKFSDTGIGMSGALQNLDLKWDAIIKALESKDDFFLYVSKSFAYFIPKRVFTSDTQRNELRSFLKSKLGERARLN